MLCLRKIPHGGSAAWFAGLAFSMLWNCSAAGELQELSVTEAGDEYSIYIETVFEAPADYVYNVITDYRRAYRINPAITEIEILPSSDAAVVRVRNHSEHWIGPFCLKIDWVGEITEVQAGHIQVITEPELSSFDSGHASWRIQGEGEHTRVVHQSSLKPKFFVPPLVGDLLMKKYLRDDTLETFNRIECNAMIMLERDMDNDPRDLKSRLTAGEDCSDVSG